jgi:GDP-mannose 6-dehydrogenase
VDISILGIGYVGAVSAACLARDGHRVIAVDVSQTKVDELNAGESPIVEPGLGELIKDAVTRGRLRATTSAEEAVLGSQLSIICVGTPSRANGSLDTSYVERVAADLGEVLKRKSEPHSVVLRSTVLPGTMHEVVLPILERVSAKQAGLDFGVGYYPEFLRESTAISDYDNPGAIVFGALDSLTEAHLRKLQPANSVAPIVVSLAEAEAVKYVNNAWHALKISFANEIGNICGALALDSHVIMNVLCSDTRLNISPNYLKPGFAFGGSCLPKDLRALRSRARELDVHTPVLDATLKANELQVEKGFELVRGLGKRKVGLLGLSFKADTDDLRESPLVVLVERLLGKGFDLRIYDENIRVSRLTGSNLAYVTDRLPHVSQLLCEELDRVLDHAEVLVVADRSLGRQALGRFEGRPVIDLIRISPEMRTNGDYTGLCW